MIGDIVGQPGRKAVSKALPEIVKEHNLSLVCANVENLAGGFGVTYESLDDLIKAGVNVFTSGNHIWDKKEVVNLWSKFPTLVRPANYPSENDGRGWCAINTPDGERVAVVNLQGRVFMPPIDDPFVCADKILKEIRAEGIRSILVDFHAEATSEKIALAKYLDGRVTAVVGTHTHVATADARVSAQGTASQTDLGMTGPAEGVIGMKYDDVIKKFLSGRPARYQVASGSTQFWALLIQLDPSSGKAQKAETLKRFFEAV